MEVGRNCSQKSPIFFWQNEQLFSFIFQAYDEGEVPDYASKYGALVCFRVEWDGTRFVGTSHLSVIICENSKWYGGH